MLMEIYSCGSASYKLPRKVFPESLAKSLFPIPPTLPDHRASRRGLPGAWGLQARSRPSFPCGCVCFSVSASNFLHGLPSPNQQEPRAWGHPSKHSPVAEQGGVGWVHSFPRLLLPASWINSDSLSHPYRHTSKCGHKRAETQEKAKTKRKSS